MLRLEANPIPKERLFSEQAKAYNKLGKLLAEAKPSKVSQGLHTNRLLFIDGVAGVGKTTVYLSFQDEHPDDYVWLEPLELSILDRPSNALADLLTHIERKCSKANGGPTTLNEKQQKVLHKLKDLQNKIALLWDGNPRERATRVSPQAFAAEVVDASEGRAQLRSKLNELIDEIAEQFFAGRMLILVVDDLHENPSVALGLLRLMRLIHSQHLAIVALGNFHSLKVIEELRTRKQLTGFLHDIDSHNERLLEDVEDRAQSLGAFSLAKLFCPSQRIRIYGPDTDALGDWDKIRTFDPSASGKGLIPLFGEVLSKSFGDAITARLFLFDGSGSKGRPAKKQAVGSVTKQVDLQMQRRWIFKLPLRNLVSMHRVLSSVEAGDGIEYPVEYCLELLEQSMVFEYRCGLPMDLFEFGVEDMNTVKLRSDHEWKEDPTASELLVYYDGRRVTSVRPTVAAWAHLLLCLAEKKELGPCQISKAKPEKAKTKKAKANARRES